MNGHSWVTSNVSRLISKELQTVIGILRNDFEKAGITFPILTSSQQLINDLKQFNIQEAVLKGNFFFLTFDFSDLYTRIKEHHMTAVLDELLRQHKISPQTKERIIELDRFVKKHSIFSIGNEFIYRQRDGLTMGSYYSQDCANMVLLYFELCFLIKHKQFVNLKLEMGMAANKYNFLHSVNIGKSDYHSNLDTLMVKN